MKAIACASLALIGVLVSSCESLSHQDNVIQCKLDKKLAVEFNQALLRDCLSFLHEQGGIDFKMTDEVASIKDLYVDLELDSSQHYATAYILNVMPHLKDGTFLLKI